MLFDVNPGVAINHPMADTISIQSHTMAMGGENTSELAFFLDDEWVIEPIPEFAEYVDEIAIDTRVYAYVPNDKIEKFLETYEA